MHAAAALVRAGEALGSVEKKRIHRSAMPVWRRRRAEHAGSVSVIAAAAGHRGAVARP
jgi:hypothetical protein